MTDQNLRAGAARVSFHTVCKNFVLRAAVKESNGLEGAHFRCEKPLRGSNLRTSSFRPECGNACLRRRAAGAPGAAKRRVLTLLGHWPTPTASPQSGPKPPFVTSARDVRGPTSTSPIERQWCRHVAARVSSEARRISPSCRLSDLRRWSFDVRFGDPSHFQSRLPSALRKGPPSR